MIEQTSFANLNLSSSLLEMLQEIGYQTPTPIQAMIIPHIINGRDVLGCAQTGTGKTASFTLPMIDILSKGRARARMPRSLVLIPTRELAMQVQKNFETYSQKTTLKQALLIGGSGFSEQEKLLDKGVDVLIATPGRLLDLYDRGKILLHDIKVLVADEADRMLDMGFMPDIERLMLVLPKNRQTLMFSATMPTEIRKLAQALLKDPAEITVSLTNNTAETIIQYVYPVATHNDKKNALRDILDEPTTQQVIVFCNTKKEATSLGTALKRNKHTVGILHGDLNQATRTETMEEFVKGQLKVLIASNVAARGLDVESISHVINYDVPTNRDDYIHRIGRTGRAGQTGISVTFIDADDAEAWQKIVSHSKEIILDYKTKQPYEVQAAVKPSKQKPSKKTKVEKTKQPEKKPAPQEQPKEDLVGFGPLTPAFMKVPLDLPKTKKQSNFFGLHDEPISKNSDHVGQA